VVTAHERWYWPPSGLTLTNLDSAVLVEQHGRRYRARGWQLTDELVRIVDIATSCGMTANWVEGHPSAPYLEGGERFDRGSHHLTFARHHDQPWVFVLGAEARPPSIRVVTFTSKLVDHIHRLGIGYRWEHAGGHNILMDPKHLHEALAGLTASGALDELNRSTQRRHTQREVLRRTGLLTEMDVEIAFLQHLKKRRRLSGPVDVRPHMDGRYPDMVLRCDDRTIIVVELKFDHAGRAALDQLQSYLRLPSMLQRAGTDRLHGVLVARTFAERIGAGPSTETVSAYQYGHDDQLHLRLHSGYDILGEFDLLQSRAQGSQ
jgi:hypothetical protein